MKALFFWVSFFCILDSYAQDSIKIKQVDSLVNIITYSNWPPLQDSILQDYPAIGLSMKTYLSVLQYNKELKKYAQVVKTIRKEGEITHHDLSGNAFYFDQDKLIKVEEFFIIADKENKMEWYYADDKCFFHTLKTDKAEDRALFLLDLAKSLLKKMANPSGGVIPR